MIKRGVGFAVDLDSPVIGSLALFYLFAFWAGEWSNIIPNNIITEAISLIIIIIITHSTDYWHSPGNGGSVCLPSCPASSLGGVPEQVL